MIQHAKSRFLLLSLFLLVSGCISFDPEDARRDQTDRFTQTLAEKERSWLSKALSLEDCLRIAMTNNYEVRLAELDRKLGRFQRQTAFSAFLPQVSASVKYLDYDKNPVTTSQRYAFGSADLGMAVFMPASWFLYDAARHGEAAAALSENYVRQSIILQTTAAYYDVRVQEEVCKATEKQVAAAKETSERVAGLEQEGYARPWEKEQALALLETRTAQLDASRRQLRVLQGELLRQMGLSPLAALTLAGDGAEPEALSATDEELVLTALENHPMLSIADRQVVIQENQVRKAICDFLPTLNVFASWGFTGNDMMNVPSANLHTGFSGTWNLLDGFANLARYRTAKAERERSKLEREQTFLSVISSVVSAHAAVQDAASDAAVRKRAYEVAAGKAEDFTARAKEGLMPLYEALDAEAQRDAAQTDYLRSAYRERVARANLDLAMGVTLLPRTEK